MGRERRARSCALLAAHPAIRIEIDASGDQRDLPPVRIAIDFLAPRLVVLGRRSRDL